MSRMASKNKGTQHTITQISKCAHDRDWGRAKRELHNLNNPQLEMSIAAGPRDNILLSGALTLDASAGGTLCACTKRSMASMRLVILASSSLLLAMIEAYRERGECN